MVELFAHQKYIIDLVKSHGWEKCGIYIKVGMGKTIIALELALNHYAKSPILVIAPKTVLSEWVKTLNKFYPEIKYLNLYDIKNKELNKHLLLSSGYQVILTSYPQIWRQEEQLNLVPKCIILDESYRIHDYSTKQTKSVNRLMKSCQHLIMLSGTMDGGHYERGLTQARLLGIRMTKQDFINSYCSTYSIHGLSIITSYHNIEDWKNKLFEAGAIFYSQLEDNVKLPTEINQYITCSPTREYLYFRKNKILNTDDIKIDSNLPVVNRLHERMLCGHWNNDKLDKISEIIESADNERIIIFYNFKEEFTKLYQICNKLKRPISYINGDGMDIDNYELENNSVTLVNYSSGSEGLNLQKASLMVFYSPPEGYRYYNQAKGRIARIDSKFDTVRYLHLIVNNSIEEQIIKSLEQGKDFEQHTYEMWDRAYNRKK